MQCNIVAHITMEEALSSKFMSL